MIKKIYGIAVIFGFISLSCTSATLDEKAVSCLEARLYKNHIRQADLYLAYFGDGLESTIRKNIHKDIEIFEKVVLNVRWVRVSKTIDTDNYVIEFTSADSVTQASLWLDKNNEVMNITPY